MVFLGVEIQKKSFAKFLNFVLYLKKFKKMGDKKHPLLSHKLFNKSGRKYV